MAGEIFATINLFVVEPTTDKAIGYEVQRDIAKGFKIDFNQFKDYRIWQKSGSFAAGAFIGMAYGALMGYVPNYVRTKPVICTPKNLLLSLIRSNRSCRSFPM
jgi:hypothetical protein